MKNQKNSQVMGGLEKFVLWGARKGGRTPVPRGELPASQTENAQEDLPEPRGES